MADMKEMKARAERVGELDPRIGAGRCLPTERSGCVGDMIYNSICAHAFEYAFWVVMVINLTCCWVPVVCSDETCVC